MPSGSIVRISAAPRSGPGLRGSGLIDDAVLPEAVPARDGPCGSLRDSCRVSPRLLYVFGTVPTRSLCRKQHRVLRHISAISGASPVQLTLWLQHSVTMRLAGSSKVLFLGGVGCDGTFGSVLPGRALGEPVRREHEGQDGQEVHGCSSGWAASGGSMAGPVLPEFGRPRHYGPTLLACVLRPRGPVTPVSQSPR